MAIPIRQYMAAIGRSPGWRWIPIVVFLISFLSITNVSAQLTLDTARGVVGGELRMPFHYDTVALSIGEDIVMTGGLKLGNPTVFFPQRFDAASGDSVINWELVRSTDSTYTFTCTVRREAQNNISGDTLCYLAGEALAGSDSLCSISLASLQVNNIEVANATGLFVLTSIGTPLPYVRFATLEPGYPNPTKPGRSVVFGYRIDKKTNVTFKVYDVAGREVVVKDEGERDFGVHIFRFTPGFDFSTGLYIVRLITNTGVAFQPLFVVR